MRPRIFTPSRVRTRRAEMIALSTTGLALCASMALASCSGVSTQPAVDTTDGGGNGGGPGGTSGTLEVTPVTASTTPGGIIDFVAQVRTATGTTPATGASWSASNTGVARVAASGQVTALAAGTSWIVASNAAQRDSALLTVGPAPETPSASCANEPTGMTMITNQPFDAVPPDLSAVDAHGWGFDRNRERLSIVSDPSAPKSPNNVAAGLFPQGWTGGRSPFRLERTFSATYTTLYHCMWIKHSPNFTDNGNGLTKLIFWRGDGTNHYYAFESGNGGGQIDGFYPKYTLQEGAGNRDFRSQFSAKPLGVWRKYEILMIGSTGGQANGVLRIWVNGTPVIQATDVAYWNATQTPGWTGISWDPTYGGGGNNVPYDMYQYIDHWYVSGR